MQVYLHISWHNMGFAPENIEHALNWGLAEIPVHTAFLVSLNVILPVIPYTDEVLLMNKLRHTMETSYYCTSPTVLINSNNNAQAIVLLFFNICSMAIFPQVWL